MWIVELGAFMVTYLRVVDEVDFVWIRGKGVVGGRGCFIVRINSSGLYVVFCSLLRVWSIGDGDVTDWV